MIDLLERVASLRAARTPFVLATVVASYPPQSVRAGAKAIILEDGSIEGWIGGGCIRPVVLDEARDALASGAPRLVRMNAGGTREDAPGVRVYPMTCQGEGGVEIYLEPVRPAPTLCILGETPVAHALARLASEVGYAVVSSANDSEAVVVATMGVGDEEALEAAAGSPASYVGLVASRKKAAFLFDYARASGVLEEQLNRIKAPAGLDLGGVSPSEIALSIMAEIVQRRRPRRREERSGEASALPNAKTSSAHAPLGLTGEGSTAIDPICGMSVSIATAKHTLEVDGETYYFCCPHCKARFAKAHA
jgi:xanthine dehydrogenase accessory factor